MDGNAMEGKDPQWKLRSTRNGASSQAKTWSSSFNSKEWPSCGIVPRNHPDNKALDYVVSSKAAADTHQEQKGYQTESKTHWMN